MFDLQGRPVRHEINAMFQIQLPQPQDRHPDKPTVGPAAKQD